MLRVINVGVKVVLEVLKHIHVLLNELVSANSWERESLVHQLPSVNEYLRVGHATLRQVLHDLHGILEMLHFEVS